MFFFSFDSTAAIKQKVDDLANFRREVLELGARLSSLEKEINNKSNLYTSSLEQIKQFESDIKIYRDELEKKQNELKMAQNENKKILKSYILESDNESADVWQKKIHLELLKIGSRKLKTKETELNGIEARVINFDQKLSELQRNEEELASVIKELKDRKNIILEKYLVKVDSKKKLESKIHHEQIHQKLAQVKKQLTNNIEIAVKPDRIFTNPLGDYLGITSSKKGVTFKFRSSQPVKAAGAGKVVYAGDLAAFGQVILIDHGDELRTVLLGRMNVKVKKNDSVGDGEILAYTLSDLREPQNLYFEVRKKNTAQNTILWLDQNGVSKI
jgi:murein DD-endopeptidase MepM/ murein hydrolase activator NlpD